MSQVAVMNFLSKWVFAGTALLLVGASACGAAPLEHRRCASGDVVVAAAGSADAETACHGAADAKAFLRLQGLKTQDAITIHIVARLPSDVKNRAFGCYSRERDRVDVLNSTTCGSLASQNGWFGMPFDRAAYRSVVAHEVAHAIASRNFKMANPSWVAQEYIAYVTQLAVLPAERRDAILKRSRASAFVNSGDINPYVLLLSPEVFAVKAYRHFVQPENGAAFLRGLLDGRFRVHVGGDRPAHP